MAFLREWQNPNYTKTILQDECRMKMHMYPTKQWCSNPPKLLRNLPIKWFLAPPPALICKFSSPSNNVYRHYALSSLLHYASLEYLPLKLALLSTFKTLLYHVVWCYEYMNDEKYTASKHTKKLLQQFLCYVKLRIKMPQNILYKYRCKELSCNALASQWKGGWTL